MPLIEASNSFLAHALGYALLQSVIRGGVKLRFMFIFKHGGMPLDVAEKSIPLFAREVMPALQDISPQPMQAAA